MLTVICNFDLLKLFTLAFRIEQGLHSMLSLLANSTYDYGVISNMFYCTDRSILYLFKVLLKHCLLSLFLLGPLPCYSCEPLTYGDKCDKKASTCHSEYPCVGNDSVCTEVEGKASCLCSAG